MKHHFYFCIKTQSEFDLVYSVEDWKTLNCNLWNVRKYHVSLLFFCFYRRRVFGLRCPCRRNPFSEMAAKMAGRRILPDCLLPGESAAHDRAGRGRARASRRHAVPAWRQISKKCGKSALRSVIIFEIPSKTDVFLKKTCFSAKNTFEIWVYSCIIYAGNI